MRSVLAGRLVPVSAAESVPSFRLSMSAAEFVSSFKLSTCVFVLSKTSSGG